MKLLFAIAFSLALLAASGAEAKKEKPPEEATLGRCLAAISIAKRNGNVWNAPFTMDECAVIAGKAIDDGLALMPDENDGEK